MPSDLTRRCFSAAAQQPDAHGAGLKRRTVAAISCYTWFVSLIGLTCRAAVAASPSIDVWSIESDKINPEEYHGETVANGMIGILSAPAPFRTQQTLIYGAYETFRPGYVSCIVSSFDFLNIAFSIDGERIERLEQVSRFHQKLDLKGAAFTTSFDYQDKATIRHTLRALRHLPYTALLEVTVTAKRPITIASTGLIEAPQPVAAISPVMPLMDVTTYDPDVVGYDFVNPTGPAKTYRQLGAASAKSQYGRYVISAAHAFMFDEPATAAPEVKRDERRIAFTKRLPAGGVYRFALVGSTLTSAHVPDPISQAQRVTFFAVSQGAKRLAARHEHEWQKIWKSNIAIEGDEPLQRDVHGMLYHLYSSIREGTSYSIPPMGLSRSSTGYLGHVYWDSEMWTFPALLALNPELAKPMIEYRYERLPGARRNAAALGYRGAMFPWESTGTGDEDTPATATTGALEHHTTADVAIAAWNYYRVTQDKDWLREKGYPLIRETADFWVSRVERNGPGRYDINVVVAVDEYAEDVDNDAFTNAAAKENLAIATAAAKLLGLPPNPDWQHVRENIPILKFPDGVTREHATYVGGKIKQTDVNLLAYPLREITDPQAIRRDLDYYYPRADHVTGPAYSEATFAILYHRLGMTSKAYQIFKDAYGPIQRPPFGTLAEHSRSPNSYFVTATGGLLQAVLFGFGGLEITDEGIVQKPTSLPAGWKSLTLTGIGPEKRTFTVK